MLHLLKTFWWRGQWEGGEDSGQCQGTSPRRAGGLGSLPNWANVLNEYSKFRCFEFWRPAARCKKFMFDNATSDSNSSPAIIFEILFWKSSFKFKRFFNLQICVTYDKVKLAAKRGRLVYVTPACTWWKSSSHFQHSYVPVFFFSTLKKLWRHVNFDKVMRNLNPPG